jgi:hypothetical protein
MSPYFPQRKDIPPYFCPKCKSWWYHGNTVCCVAHPPGSCCHEYESPASDPRRGVATGEEPR